MNTRAAFIGIGYQLWRRTRGVLLATAALILSLAVAVHVIGSPEWARLVALAGICAIGFTAPFFIQAFTYGGDLGSPESAFPRHMMVLPLGARDLTLAPILYGACFLAALWIVAGQLVLRPAGIPVPLVRPALTIAAAAAWLSATSWMPCWLPYARVIACGGIMTAITAFALATRTRALTLPEPGEIAGLVAMTALAFPVAAHGVARARRGDGTVPPWAAHRMTAATVRPPRRSRPFGSAERAQIWFELRRNGTMAILFFLMMTAIMLPTLLLPSQHIDLVDVFIAPVPFLTTAVFLALQVLWFGIAGGNLARPDAWKPALEPSAFLAARAMSDRQLISAKVKASAVVVVFAWAIVLGLVGLSMLVPHGAPQSETLAHFLRRHATPQGIGMAAAAIAGLVLLSWLAVLKSFAVTLYGRQWITHARVYGAVLLICGLAVAAHWAWLHRESPVLFLAARVVVWALIAAKVGTAMLIVFATRRGGIARGGRLIAWTATWLLATAALFGLTFWLAPGVRHSPAALAATIVLVVPFNRLIAMPLAWHHNRHR